MTFHLRFREGREWTWCGEGKPMTEPVGPLEGQIRWADTCEECRRVVTTPGEWPPNVDELDWS